MKFHEINLPGYVDVVTMPLLIHWKFINLKFLPFDTNEIYLVNVCVSCLLPHMSSASVNQVSKKNVRLLVVRTS